MSCCRSGSVARKELDELLMSKLPERMTEQQKRDKVRNLVQELRQNGHIMNQGHHGDPQWVLNDSGLAKL
jgi:hypothetical protein